MSKESDVRDHEDDKRLPGTGDLVGGRAMTTLVAGAAVAVLAPELLPGMAIGVAARVRPAGASGAGRGAAPAHQAGGEGRLCGGGQDLGGGGRSR